ncbi:UDP-2,3-diacylglucosamine diphosphatase, partial [Stenotrophomonas sp. HMWF023]
MTTLFISDLHLDPSRPAITDLFLRFLREEAPGADALYILGDLFEAWIGDDTPSAAADAVADALKVLSDSGVPVFFIRGNRDFLLGEDYARRAGLRILPDPCMIELYGRPVLLQHGDLLCTDDIPYQQFRAQTRDPVFQAQFLSQPLEARIAFAQKARDASQARQSEMKQGDRAQFETVTDVA